MGCGQLPYLNLFDENEISNYYGIDLSYSSLGIAKRNFKKKFPLLLLQHGVFDVPFPDESCDAVISSEVIEHLENPRAYLLETYRVLKKGGYLSLSTPNVSLYFYPHNILNFLKNPRGWLKKVNAHKYWEEALSWHPGLRPEILKSWLAEVGFKVVRHESKLWYYHTPIKLFWRTCLLGEKLGIKSSHLFRYWLAFTDKILDSNLPLIKWAGIRQFILGCK